jgi:hypothetical protein
MWRSEIAHSVGCRTLFGSCIATTPQPNQQPAEISPCVGPWTHSQLLTKGLGTFVHPAAHRDVARSGDQGGTDAGGDSA